ncbi:GNAT family N-acetyltransferase [Gryllotalpicola ginsengisoli]|uniref:GNAT family N-acetyltransferase n=1 Tax=Gryllotalpicola ginsengisoli TaxID=444608 RepID=UPI0003B63986|nr:GNAT family N-acetyltransferase [Gryllotalpicola ginsengisoli]
MTVQVLSATGRFADFASFMVPKRGRGCVCIAYRNSSLDMPGRVAHMEAECATEPGPGVLAYVDGEVAGWLSVAPKATFRALVNSRTIPHIDDEDVWSANCFVIRAPFRRRGLMHELLEGGIAHAREHGAVGIEGYPVEAAGTKIDQTSAYVGTVELFEAHGFERVQLTAGKRGGRPRWLVRRPL